jgi:hypothetical protein
MSDFNTMVAQVEKRIAEKRARLMELLSDPDLAPYVAALRHQGPSVNGAKPFVPPAGFKNGNGVREAIRKLLDDHSHPFFQMRQFDRQNVKNFLDEIYGKDTYSVKSIGDALHHLSTLSKNKVVKKMGGGEGGKPNLYERV